MPRIRLLPSGTEIELAAGTTLADALFARGVEFPCGGHGRCRGCRVRVRVGRAAIDEHDRRAFDRAELDAGWRLACRLRGEDDCSLELAQWETPILAEAAAFALGPDSGFAAGEGFGIAVDIGTTTVVAQLVDLATAAVRGVRSAVNPQCRHGADLMTRLDHAVGGGAAELRELLRRGIGRLVTDLLAAEPAAGAQLQRIVLVGNTAMHHLFAGLDCGRLARHPFEPSDGGRQRSTAAELGWTAAGAVPVEVLPILGGFVGSDILAGILATGMHRAEGLQVLLDLGTNGEVVVGDRRCLLVASTAAGPAFEGARIARGMRAATGAIARVAVVDGALSCEVLGGGEARGICGSGLVDAAAAALELGLVEASGRLSGGTTAIPLRDGVALCQQDLRELQLAKGAIAAGLEVLLARWGASLDRVERIHLAGAFGNYVDRRSAARIGLIPVDDERVASVGNSALLGARMALFDRTGQVDAIAALVEHVPLEADLAFVETYVDHMAFPATVPG